MRSYLGSKSATTTKLWDTQDSKQRRRLRARINLPVRPTKFHCHNASSFLVQTRQDTNKMHSNITSPGGKLPTKQTKEQINKGTNTQKRKVSREREGEKEEHTHRERQRQRERNDHGHRTTPDHIFYVIAGGFDTRKVQECFGFCETRIQNIRLGWQLSC